MGSAANPFPEAAARMMQGTLSEEQPQHLQLCWALQLKMQSSSATGQPLRGRLVEQLRSGAGENETLLSAALKSFTFGTASIKK